MTKRKIRQVHFQITRNCNLRCSFCGQWGKKGFFSDSSGIAMTFADWERVIAELARYKEKSMENITVTVWGGEPLVSPYFDEIMALVKHHGFKSEVITNGTLINAHAETLKKYADRIYLSLDGTREVHNSIRGQGVFETVSGNLRDLSHKNVTVMSVITPRLINELDEFLDELEGFGIKELYLQDMIGLSCDEVAQYAHWLESAFGIKAENIDSWENNELFKVEKISAKKHSFAIKHKKHISDGYCKSPFEHMHIAWNGNVMYCTDFYDFFAGNVKENAIEDIFYNEKSEQFREEILNNRCITCKHCSWRTKEYY